MNCSSQSRSLTLWLVLRSPPVVQEGNVVLAAPPSGMGGPPRNRMQGSSAMTEQVPCAPAPARATTWVVWLERGGALDRSWWAPADGTPEAVEAVGK